MAEQILKVKLVADVGQSEAALKLFTDSAKDAGVSIEKVFKAVNVETDKIAYDIKVTADELDKLDKAFKSAKAKFSEDETTKLSSSFVEVTKNIDAEAARIAKSRQKGFEEDLAKRTTRLKESLSLELALIREGENSITAIKLESASKQRKLEEKLQEDLAAVKEKFVASDITVASKNAAINKLYASYKEATVKLNELTDERIAKAKQEVADFNLVEKKLAETSARRVKLVEDREKALTDIQISEAKKSQEIQNALIKQTVDSLIITEDREYKRLLAARKANAEAAFRAIPSLMEQLGASASYKPDEEKLKIARKFAALSLAGVEENLKIEAKLKDNALAAEKERLARIEFDTKASYNARKVMYADLMRQMDEADAARAAKEKERATRAPQASRDDRGYVPFAMGTVGGNRAAAQATTSADKAVSASRAQILQEAETRAFLRRRASLDGEDKAVQATTRAYKSLGTHIAEVIGIYRIYNAAINLTEQALLSIPKALIELQTATASLTATFGSFAGATRELAFLNEEATRTGIAITTLRESYAQASASFIMAGESAETTRNIFRDINTVATTLHLNADKVSSVFLALSQMFNKGKVQAEELTKQLSQTLPGITNQTAKALGLSAAQLGESMKKGLITAHEAVQLMSRQIAETFGGEAFNRATEGLNSSLGRLSTAWTLFAESMGKVTESTMKAFVDGATSTINTLTSFTSQTEKATEAFNLLLATLSGAAIAAAIAGLEKLTAASIAFTMTPVGRIAAIAAAITSVGAAFYLSGKQADEASKSLDKYLEAAARKQRGEIAPLGKVNIQRPEDNEAYKYALKQEELAVKEYQQALKASGEGLDRATTKYYKDRIQLAKGEAARVYGEALAQPAEEIRKETTDASDEIARAQELFLAATDKKVESKRMAFLRTNKKAMETLMKAYAEGNAEAGEALQKMQQAYMKAGEDIGGGKKADKVNKKNYKASFEDIRNSASLIQADLTEALGNIDILYQQNAMSIETYFSQKMQLQETDLAVQKEMLNQELQLAYAQKDKVKIQKLNGELIKAETDANKLATKTIIEKTNAERGYANILANINAEYAKTFGTTISTVEAADAAEQKFLATNGAYILQLSIAADKGDELAASRLKQLYALKDNAVVQEQLNDIETRRNELITEYEAKLQRINNQFQSGALSQLSAWSLSDDAKTRLEKDLEELQAKQQEALTSQGTGVQLSDKVKREVEKSKNYLEDLKTQGSAMANKLEDAFNNSFTNAFTGFANGTMTAKQAFSSLITSMIGEIQKLIAQEMASAALRSVIRPLAGWAMGDMFSSGQSAAFTDTFSKSGTDFWGAGATKIWPNANGGVFSGSGISAYSGSVVSTPTIFPFAKGTGLMGEAGPEAILPLTRNSKGKLGVIADSTGQSGGNVYNIEVTVQSSKDEKPADTGQKIAEAMMRTIAKQEIGLAARPGNSLNRTTKFG
jgi:lambda family phage tail tape measure protein